MRWLWIQKILPGALNETHSEQNSWCSRLTVHVFRRLLWVESLKNKTDSLVSIWVTEWIYKLKKTNHKCSAAGFRLSAWSSNSEQQLNVRSLCRVFSSNKNKLRLRRLLRTLLAWQLVASVNRTSLRGYSWPATAPLQSSRFATLHRLGKATAMAPEDCDDLTKKTKGLAVVLPIWRKSLCFKRIPKAEDKRNVSLRVSIHPIWACVFYTVYCLHPFCLHMFQVFADEVGFGSVSSENIWNLNENLFHSNSETCLLDATSNSLATRIGSFLPSLRLSWKRTSIKWHLLQTVTLQLA